MLRLVLLVYRVPHAEGSRPALQTTAAGGKGLCRYLSPGRCAEARPLTLSPRWRRQAVCRHALRRHALQSPAIWSVNTAAPAPAPGKLCPLPAPRRKPCKAGPPPAYGRLGESVCAGAGARTFSFLDQRIKLSFASELNSVYFYRLKQHGAGGPLFEMDPGGWKEENIFLLGLLHRWGLLPPAREEERRN